MVIKLEIMIHVFTIYIKILLPLGHTAFRSFFSTSKMRGGGSHQKPTAAAFFKRFRYLHIWLEHDAFIFARHSFSRCVDLGELFIHYVRIFNKQKSHYIFSIKNCTISIVYKKWKIDGKHSAPLPRIWLKILKILV